jgi:hypothetical protein
MKKPLGMLFVVVRMEWTTQLVNVFQLDKTLSEEDILATYEKLSQGDTVAVKFKSNQSICKEKGLLDEFRPHLQGYCKIQKITLFCSLVLKNSHVIIGGKTHKCRVCCRFKAFFKDWRQITSSIIEKRAV